MQTKKRQAPKEKLVSSTKMHLLDKTDGHLWGLADAILEHGDNLARFGEGTLKHEGEDIRLLAQELRDFLEKNPAQRRKIVAGNLRYYNRWRAITMKKL